MATDEYKIDFVIMKCLKRFSAKFQTDWSLVQGVIKRLFEGCVVVIMTRIEIELADTM